MKEMVQNLAHEMIHAKQFLRGELATNMDKWKGVVYKSKDGDVFDFESPWEKEAYGTEDVLYNNYVNDGGHNGRRK